MAEKNKTPQIPKTSDPKPYGIEDKNPQIQNTAATTTTAAATATKS